MLLIYCLAEELIAPLEVLSSMDLVSYPALLRLIEDGWYQHNCFFRRLPYRVSRPPANTTEVAITILAGHIEETL